MFVHHCPSCGGELNYEPGSLLIKCNFCNYEQRVKQEKSELEAQEIIPAELLNPMAIRRALYWVVSQHHYVSESFVLNAQFKVERFSIPVYVCEGAYQASWTGTQVLTKTYRNAKGESTTQTQEKFASGNFSGDFCHIVLGLNDTQVDAQLFDIWERLFQNIDLSKTEDFDNRYTLGSTAYAFGINQRSAVAKSEAMVDNEVEHDCQKLVGHSHIRNLRTEHKTTSYVPRTLCLPAVRVTLSTQSEGISQDQSYDIWMDGITGQQIVGPELPSDPTLVQWLKPAKGKWPLMLLGFVPLVIGLFLDGEIFNGLHFMKQVDTVTVIAGIVWAIYILASYSQRNQKQRQLFAQIRENLYKYKLVSDGIDSDEAVNFVPGQSLPNLGTSQWVKTRFIQALVLVAGLLCFMVYGIYQAHADRRDHDENAHPTLSQNTPAQDARVAQAKHTVTQDSVRAQAQPHVKAPPQSQPRVGSHTPASPSPAPKKSLDTQAVTSSAFNDDQAARIEQLGQRQARQSAELRQSAKAHPSEAISSPNNDYLALFESAFFNAPIMDTQAAADFLDRLHHVAKPYRLVTSPYDSAIEHALASSQFDQAMKLIQPRVAKYPGDIELQIQYIYAAAGLNQNQKALSHAMLVAAYRPYDQAIWDIMSMLCENTAKTHCVRQAKILSKLIQSVH